MVFVIDLDVLCVSDFVVADVSDFVVVLTFVVEDSALVVERVGLGPVRGLILISEQP